MRETLAAARLAVTGVLTGWHPRVTGAQRPQPAAAEAVAAAVAAAGVAAGVNTGRWDYISSVLMLDAAR